MGLVPKLGGMKFEMLINGEDSGFCVKMLGVSVLSVPCSSAEGSVLDNL